MSKLREYIGINPGGDSNALISVLVPEDFYALKGSHNHTDKIHLIEKSAYDALMAQAEVMANLLNWFMHANPSLRECINPFGDALENWRKFKEQK